MLATEQHLAPGLQVGLVRVKVLALQVVVASDQGPGHAEARQVLLRKLEGLPTACHTLCQSAANDRKVVTSRLQHLGSSW